MANYVRLVTLHNIRIVINMFINCLINILKFGIVFFFDKTLAKNKSSHSKIADNIVLKIIIPTKSVFDKKVYVILFGCLNGNKSSARMLYYQVKNVILIMVYWEDRISNKNTECHIWTSEKHLPKFGLGYRII